MSATYGPAVTAILTALKNAITARATADGISVAEVGIGERTGDRSFQNGAIYIFAPDDQATAFGLPSGRHATLRIPVVCKALAYDDAGGTARMIELTGLVVDAIGTSGNLGGACVSARPASVEHEAAVGDDGDVVYLATVTIEADVIHQLP